jgi:hypothetical protein
MILRECPPSASPKLIRETARFAFLMLSLQEERVFI